MATRTLDNRTALAAIGTVSLAAIGFLFWLIYFNEGVGSDTPDPVRFLPAVNASLNGLSASFLVAGFVAIRRGRIDRHRMAMVAAFVSSSLFLVSYVVYHALHGDTPFRGTGWIRPVYFFILISHIVLSVVVLPMVFTTFFFSLTRQFRRHRRIARWTLPLWLYVSVTGVLVFALLKVFNP